MFIVSLRSVYGPGPSQGVHRADGPGPYKHFIWTRFKMGFHGHLVHVLSVLSTREVSAYTRQAFKLGDDNQERLLTYISVLHKVY